MKSEIKRPKIDVKMVWRAMLEQFAEEKLVSQKGVLNRIGYGSEATIAKFMKEIRADGKNVKAAIFSPELPQELVVVFERLWNSALDEADRKYQESRDSAQEIADNAMLKLGVNQEELEKEREYRLDLEKEIVSEGHKVELIESKNVSLSERLHEKEVELLSCKKKLQSEVEKLPLEIEKLVLKHKGEVQELTRRNSEVELRQKLQIAELETKSKSETEQVIFERQRSEAETARLYQEIDSLKLQAKEERILAGESQKRIEAELNLSHAREDNYATKAGKFEDSLKRKEYECRELSQKVSVHEASLSKLNKELASAIRMLEDKRD